MTRTTRTNELLPSFRRTLAYLHPHRRPLIIGLILAVGVSVFYTFSISSAIPLLKVMFSDHETIGDWLHRVETERRLGISLIPDLPDDPAGLRIDRVHATSPAGDKLHAGDRIVSVAGQAPGSYGLLRLIAGSAQTQLDAVRVVSADEVTRELTLPIAGYRWWWGRLRDATGLLPAGRDAHSRLVTLAIVMASLVAISLLGSICRFANESLIAIAVQRAMHGVRSDLADHVLRLPLDWYSRHPPGDTLGRFSTDIAKVEVGLWTLFGKSVREPLKALGVLALTIAIDWRILVVALLGLPVAAVVIRVFGRMIKRSQKHASQSWGRLLDHLGERFAGIRVVKAYNMQTAESRRFELEGRTLTRAQTHIEMVDAATKPSLETLAMVAVAGFVLYGGSRVFQQQLEPHLFLAAVICLGAMFDPVRKLGNVNNRLQQAEVSARRLFELIDLPAEEGALPCQSARELPPFSEAIAFEGLSFAYPANPTRLVIADISLRVQRGQVVGLVGPNGSGKTTLMSLLLRFHEPSRGRIRIDGHNIAEVTLASLRGQIGLVTQDAVIFSDTVRANIAYGGEGWSEDAIQQAARRAHVDEFVRDLRVEHGGHVTQGYDARINARSLSGGQRQRLALARAILRDPPILILDEATSQVDSDSERKIQAALEDVTRGRTTFIIAHRFSTIARASLIVALNEGRIVGCGPHDELLTTCPFYAALCKTQFAHSG
ncbi:MAG: ATP-binding cassette domain-containing protein [Planctomycetes bacterium]|nr:ATP-binding cassette domain-containing protein [Planctomycetota bacterium]